MSINGILEDIGMIAVAVAVGIGIGGAGGYKLGAAHDAAKVADAKLATATAQTAALELTGTLAQVRTQLAAQKQSLLAAEQSANAALAARNDAQKALAAAESARATQDWKIAHETPNAAALARMPIYPGLAERLFDPGAAPGASAGAAGG